MHERAQQPTFAVHAQIPRCPDRRRSPVAGENCVLACEFVNLARNKLRMTAAAIDSFGRKFVESFSRFTIMLETPTQVFVVVIFLQLWQESLKSHLGIADQSVVELCAAAQLFSSNVDLNNRSVFRKELLIREIRADHQQSVAVHHRKVTGGKSEQASHADIKWIVVLDEFLAAQRMDDWRVQLAGDRDQLGMGFGTTRARENRDLLRIIK